MFLLIGLARRMLVLVVVLAIPVVGGELLTRKLVGDAISSAVKRSHRRHSRTSASARRRSCSSCRTAESTRATVRAKGARIGGLPPVR